MANKRLADFIRKSLKRGVSERQIRNSLLQKGWKKSLVDEAFNSVRNLGSSQNPKGKMNPSGKTREKTERKLQKNSSKKVQKPQKEKAKNSGENPFGDFGTSKKSGGSSLEKPSKKTAKKEKPSSSKPKAVSKPAGSKKSKQKESGNAGGMDMNKKILYIAGPLLLITLVIVLIVVFSSSTISESELQSGKEVSLEKDDKVKFELDNKKHSLNVKDVDSGEVSIEIQSDTFSFDLEEGDIEKVDFDDDGVYDLEVEVVSVSEEDTEFFLMKISEDVCTPDWNCTEWGECIGGTQERTCNDINECGTDEGKPEETQSCECVPEWNCTDWGECINETQERTCTDEHSCGDTSEKPAEVQNCTVSYNCSELNGTLCDSSEICNGTELNSSDSGVCCDGNCVLNSSSDDQTLDYSSFEEANLTEVCQVRFELSNISSFNDTLEMCSGNFYGTSLDIDGESYDVFCCDKGKIIERYNFSGQPKQTYESLSLSGKCNSSLADAFENCQEYKCYFTHPFTGDVLNKSVIGRFEGNCHYYEQMPNEGYEYCKINETMQQSLSQCYESYYSGDFSACQEELQALLDRGDCQVFE